MGKPGDFTPEQIQGYLDTFELFREPAKQFYLSSSIDRFIHTMNLIPRLPDAGRVKMLEIGGMPYFMTVLVRKFLGYDVQVANEPGPDRDARGSKNVLVNETGDRYVIDYRAFDIEYDPWPYNDGTFDIVLYCEVIEHLVYDPTHTLVEAHRVLKKDTGTLLISTPNALSYTSLVQMLRGENFYPPYSGYGSRSRHHRLFSPGELNHLVRKVGFDVRICHSTRDAAYPRSRGLETIAKALARLGLLKNRLDVIYLVATPVGEAKYAYPDRPPFVTYTDVHGYGRVESAVVRMADESLQLLGGFYDPENWGGGVRWTGNRARLVLRCRGERELSVTLFSGPRSAGDDVRGWVAMSNEGLSFEVRHEFTVPASSWQTLTFPVPDNPPSKLVVTIGVDNPMVPQEVDPASRDSRRLGVAIREVALGGPQGK